MNSFYYFAYGSNMDNIQMLHRCPYAIKRSIGFIKNYELIVSHKSKTWGGGVFSIKEKKNSMVYGVLWEVTPDDLMNLDYYEGFPKVYNKNFLNVSLIGKFNEKKDEIKAIVYVSNKNEECLISEKYLEYCKNAAKNQGIKILF